MLPMFLTHGGPMIWLILGASAIGVVVFFQRVLHYHRAQINSMRAQINSMEFLKGVRNVLKRDRVLEALSICDATPGPVARLVKVAILNREGGQGAVPEAWEEAGLIEIQPLEDKLNLIATIVQNRKLCRKLCRNLIRKSGSARTPPQKPLGNPW